MFSLDEPFQSFYHVGTLEIVFRSLETSVNNGYIYSSQYNSHTILMVHNNHVMVHW